MIEPQGNYCGLHGYIPRTPRQQAIDAALKKCPEYLGYAQTMMRIGRAITFQPPHYFYAEFRRIMDGV